METGGGACGVSALGILSDLPLGRAAAVRPGPDFLVNPVTKLDHAFAEFHAAHPELYREVERRAIALNDAGAPHIGLAMIFEAIRYDAAVRKDWEAYKCNNSWRAYYARLLKYDHPELREKIETREQHEPLSRERVA